MGNANLHDANRQTKRKVPSPPRKKGGFFVLVFLFIFLLFALVRPALAPAFKDLGEERPKPAQSQEKAPSSSFEEGLLADPLPKADLQEVKSLRLFAVGDIMHHLEQAQRVDRGLSAAKDEFFLIRSFFHQADLVIGNFESTSNSDKALSGYPMFNTPEAIFPALKDAGFRILTTVNNHSLDTGISGVKSTIKKIRDNDMVPVGTRLPGEKRTALVDVKGIKLGVCAYAYGFNGLENGQSSQTMDLYLNELNPSEIEADIRDLKTQGADFILVYPHWGEEYSSVPTPAQRDLAQKMIGWGADAVIGNHPHVIQPCEWVETSEGRKGFVLYACGNFISMQRHGQFSDYREEQSALVELNLEKVGEDPAKIKEVRIHPLWVRESRDREGLLYQPLLAEEYRTGGPKSGDLTDRERSRVDRAYREIKDQVLGQEEGPVAYGNE